MTAPCRICGVSATDAAGMVVWTDRVIRRPFCICWTCIEEAAAEIAKARGDKRYAVTLNDDGLVAGFAETAQSHAKGDAAT